MKHSIRTTWISFISIVVMLMSAYASSAPLVSMSGHSNPNSQSAYYESVASDCHGSSERLSHHEHHPKQEVVSENAHEPTHRCFSGADSGHGCCGQLCFSQFYLLKAGQTLQSPATTFALHDTIVIGETRTRPQSLLRPPSA